MSVRHVEVGRWTHPVIVDPGEDVVADGAEEDDGLRGAAPTARHQLHAHHLAVPHHDVAEHLHNTLSVRKRMIVT